MGNVKRTERGWAGHFICADRCRFRRNTLLECGEKRIVISSVGLMEKQDYRPEGYKKAIPGFETIGCERYYETMAFHAVFESPYWEADVSRQVSFDSEWALNECEQISDQKFNDIHDRVCDEITEKLLRGEPL